MPATASRSGSHHDYAEHLALGRAARKRIEDIAITRERAQTDGFLCFAGSGRQGWSIARHADVLALEQAVRDLGAVDCRLVLRAGRISIWRKR